LILATLGLLRVADTVIGNDMIKGVSGGEARRVTLGEQLVTGGKVLLLDEISTGLDSAATFVFFPCPIFLFFVLLKGNQKISRALKYVASSFDITKAIRAMARVFNLTVVVSLTI